MNQQAITYWDKAGRIAMSRSFNVEAANHITKGLELLETLPESPERAPQELALQTLLGQCMIQVKGYTAPEVQQAFTRARPLIDQIGETTQFFQVLFGLWTYCAVRGGGNRL